MFLSFKELEWNSVHFVWYKSIQQTLYQKSVKSIFKHGCKTGMFSWFKCKSEVNTHSARLWWLTIWTNRAIDPIHWVHWIEIEPYQYFEKSLVWSVFARLISDIRVRVIDVQIYTHFELNKCLCVQIRAKANIYLVFPQHRNWNVKCTHVFMSQTYLILCEFTQFSLHIKKTNPLCFVCVCVYVEWWFTLNKQCDDFSIDTCNQM